MKEQVEEYMIKWAKNFGWEGNLAAISFTPLITKVDLPDLDGLSRYLLFPPLFHVHSS